MSRKCHGADLGQYSVESWLTADFGWILSWVMGDALVVVGGSELPWCGWLSMQ